MDGHPVKIAAIDFSGIGRAASNENGLFEISVPFSRQSDMYTLYAFAEGFKAQPIIIKGRKPDFISLKFSFDIKIEDYFEEHDAIYLSQNVGDPLITFGFRTHKEISGRAKLQLYEMKLKTPSDDFVSFFPVTHSRNGVLDIARGDIILDRDNQSSEYSLMSSPQADKISVVFKNISVQSGQNWFSDCISKNTATEYTIKELQKSFDSAFLWQSGSYILTIRYRIEDVLQETQHKFFVSPSESIRLRNMRNEFERCQGMAFDLTQMFRLSYYSNTA